MKYRPILIKPCLNGFVVEVGCQTLVFLNLKDVAAALEKYSDDPEGMENMYIQDSFAKVDELRAERPPRALNEIIPDTQRD